MGICGKRIDKGHKENFKKKDDEIGKENVFEIEKKNNNYQKPAEKKHQQKKQSSSTIQNIKREKIIYDTKISDNKIASKKSYNNAEIKQKKVDTKINIIYLLDMTKSMKKYRDIIYLIKEINISMKKKYANIKFGYVLYRDFENGNFQKKLGTYNHIEIIQLNQDDILPESKIEFKGGEDWAEDWANAYYTVSQIDFSGVKENIIIHICDAGAHSNFFSDYDDHNEQEDLLKEALTECHKKNLKIIGLLYNNFSRKSFVQCQNYYDGYYDIVDLACFGKEFNKEIIQEKIQKALKNERIFKIDNYTNIDGFENDFIYNGKKVSMHYPNGLSFLPDLENNST
jgi:hypothetical protein